MHDAALGSCTTVCNYSRGREREREGKEGGRGRRGGGIGRGGKEGEGMKLNGDARIGSV